MNTYERTTKKSLSMFSKRVSMLAGATAVLMGCGGEVIDTSITFVPAAGVFSDIQSVSVQLPEQATNVYLSTNTLAPEANAACSYAGEALTIDRPTVVKITYDVEGETYTGEAIYVVEQNYTDSNFTNRDVIFSWEKFFLEDVVRQFSPDFDLDRSTLQLSDGNGGNVWLHTNVIERSILFDSPERGSQLYEFEFFEGTMEETNTTVMLEKGAVYGYLGDGSGFYTTQSNGGKRIEYAGTYRGWAEGDFTLNGNAEAVADEYLVQCYNVGCSQHPVYYVMDSRRQLVEVSAVAHDNTRSCINEEE